MLEHLGYPKQAKILNNAVEEQIHEGSRTPDLVPFLGGPAATTEAVGEELLKRVQMRL
jgi:isocitrate/isopropylmalate dehydrogenase